VKILFLNNNAVQSYSQFYKWRWSKFSQNIQNICGYKSETIWYMGLKICMGDKTHRYYKHTRFHQNPRGDSKFLVDLTWNDP